MGDEAAVGIDVGTTNVKVVLVDTTGRVHARAERSLVASVAVDEAAGSAELDAEAQWQAVADAVRTCVRAAPEVAARVTAVGVDSQYSSIVAVDADGVPVAPMRLWSDRRGTARCRAVVGHEGALDGFMDRHGLPPLGGGSSLGHVLTLQHDHPEVHAATAAYLEPMDYVNARLTGRIVANQATQFMGQMVDNRRLDQTGYDDALLEWSGVDATRLPALASLDEPVATLRADVADALGLPRGAVVAAGINDTQAGSVAAGVGRAGRAGLSVGTTAVLVDTVADKRADLDHALVSCPGPFSDQYLLFAENGIAGAAVEHVVERLVDTGGFATLDAVLAATEPGAGGVMFLPWLRGSMAPRGDARMRGGFINLGLDTDRAAMVRAAVEGVAHNLAWLVPFAEALTGDGVVDVVFSGGGARSAGVAQVVADVIDRRVVVGAEPSVAIARATALLALHRTGTLSRADLATVVPPGDDAVVCEPVESAHAIYAGRQPHFEAAFDALAPIVRALRRP